jgi:hypothetical protein
MRLVDSDFSMFSRNSEVPERAMVPRFSASCSLVIPIPESVRKRKVRKECGRKNGKGMFALPQPRRPEREWQDEKGGQNNVPRMTILRLSLSAKTLTFSAGAASRIFGSVRAVKRTFSRASLALETVGGDERSACGAVNGLENLIANTARSRWCCY